MSWFKYSQQNVIIDTTAFSKSLWDYLKSIEEVPVDNIQFNSMLSNFRGSIVGFQQKYPQYSESLNPILMMIDSKADFHDVEEGLWDLRSQIESYDGSSKSREWRNILKISGEIWKYYNNSYMTEEWIKEEHLRQVGKVNSDATIASNFFNQAIANKPKNIPLSMVQIVALPYNAISLQEDDEGSSFEVFVGEKEMRLYFSIEVKNGKVEMAGDELEEYDEIIEDWGRPAFNAVTLYNFFRKYIKNPSIVSLRPKIKSVYTARPITDFNIYENAKTVPNYIFVSTDYNFVEGFAIDNAPKDIWKIRISEYDLIDSVDNVPGKVFQVMSGEGGDYAPILGIEHIDRIGK